MMFALSASAQVQLLFMEGGRNVIDRNKKMYWMDGDDDPCYNIFNYKKSGNKETFTLKGKENPNDVYNVVMSLDGSISMGWPEIPIRPNWIPQLQPFPEPMQMLAKRLQGK